jgi:type I restriction enzyme S subunit
MDKRQLSDCDVVVEGSGECGRSLAISSSMLSMFSEPLVYSNFCKRIRFKSPGMAQIAEFVLNDLVRSGEMKNYVTGTAMPNLDVHGLLSSVRIPVPPDALIERFNDHMRATLSKLYSSESRTLTTLRDTLLPKLLSGEVLAE